MARPISDAAEMEAMGATSAAAAANATPMAAEGTVRRATFMVKLFYVCFISEILSIRKRVW